MKKKLIIISSIMVILLIASIFISRNLKDDSKNIYFETSQTNIVNSNSLNIIENELVNDITNDTITDTINVVSPSAQTTISKNVNDSNDTKNVSKNVSTNKTDTKEEVKTNTKDTLVTETKPTQNTNNQPTNDKKEEKPTTPTQTPRPELAYSTYRVTNTAIVPEIIKILNDEISKDNELISLGTKAVKGNKKDAYAKTSGFTYLFVSDIEKGKVSGNYVSFPQRVRNNVGSFGNYNVYAEDEFTYNGQGLNPKWSQTLVWIYITF